MNIEDSDELTLIFNYRKDKTMVLVNEVELATVLAHNAMLSKLLNQYNEDDNGIDNSDIYTDGEDGTEYTDFAQGIFDENYDYFYDIIVKIANKEEE